MAEHVAEYLNLARLAAQAGLSKFHFERLFKNAMGVSPSRYHINLRMNLARRLLRETKKSVVDVALEVGYADPSHFAKLFRRENQPFPKRLPSAPLTPASLRISGNPLPSVAIARCGTDVHAFCSIALRAAVSSKTALGRARTPETALLIESKIPIEGIARR
jgi:AraC-like DNA-binding protein